MQPTLFTQQSPATDVNDNANVLRREAISDRRPYEHLIKHIPKIIDMFRSFVIVGTRDRVV